jgi:predicted Rdx family selenoprotein
LNDRTPHEAEPVSGAKSQFDVVADGELIFSKQREGRWPEADEIIRALGADSSA